MANTSAPFGLKPVRYKNGTPWNGQCRPYYCNAGYATALYIGDPVAVVGDSNDNEYRGFPPGTLSEIELASAGDAAVVTGVIVRFEIVTAESTLHRAASTERIAYVADDPNIIFEVQDDGGGTPSADWVGLNANLIAGSGSAVTGLSGWKLDGGTSDGPDADASNQLLILGLAARVGPRPNEIGDYAVWEVLINQHSLAPGALGVA